MSAALHAVRPYTIPKPGGGVRLMGELDPADAPWWRALALSAARPIERALGREVVSERPGAFGSQRPLPVVLEPARRAARRLGGQADVMVRTDVRACYPSVDASVLARTLGVAGVSRRTAFAVADGVEAWSGLGHAGLPVGPPPSAVLAHAVLAPVDAALRRARIAFVRWVDDYLLVPPSGHDPAFALDAFDEVLEGVCLERSLVKTRLGTPAEIGVWPGRGYPA